MVRHDRPSDLRSVDQACDLAAPNVADLALPKLGVDQPLQRGAPLLDRAQPLAVAVQEFIGNGLQRVGGRALRLPPIGQRVAALGGLADNGLGLALGFIERQAAPVFGFERHAPGLALGAVLHHERFVAVRSDH